MFAKIYLLTFAAATIFLLIACSAHKQEKLLNGSGTNSTANTTAQVTALEVFGQQDCIFDRSGLTGSTNQGGYAFEYDSQKGKSQLDECRLYRVRNIPGKLLTPVLWKDSDEILLQTNLAGCAKSTICPWVTVQKRALRVSDGNTELSYGINSDEYKEKPAAYKKHPSETASVFPRLVTTISGVIADSKGEPLEISVRVTSSVTGEAPAYQLSYEIQTGPETPKLALDPIATVDTDAIRFSWSAAMNEQFIGELRQKEVSWLYDPYESTAIHFSARNIRRIDQHPLTIKQGDKLLFATTAPAYVPVGVK